MSNTSEQQTEAQAFEQAFADERSEPAFAASTEQQTTTAPAAENTSAANGAAEGAADAANPEPKPDPFESLAPEVRRLLADSARMSREFEGTRRLAGMVPALQRKIDQLERAAQQPAAPTAAPPAPAPPRFEKVAALREQGLPEIADALEELASALPPKTKAPEPKAPAAPQAQAPSQAPAAPDLVAAAEETLANVRPGWEREVLSDEFQLWLSRQPAEYQAEVASTDKAWVILKSLEQWRPSKARTPQPPPAPNPQRARMAAAVTPRGDGQRSRAPIDEELAAFNAGYNSA